MGSQYRALGVSLAMIALASCAGSEMDTKVAARAEPAPEQAADEAIMVTGSRLARPDLSSPSPVSVASMAPPPPPPPMMAAPGYWAPTYQDVGRDKFTSFDENMFRIVREAPVSTFSIDVDTASYSWVRASLNQNVLPQPAAVRTEEMVNYFQYDYAPPRTAAQPFSTNVAVFPSPWAAGRKLVRVGIKGYAVQKAARPRANLVFLVDTSGSMNHPSKLPLVQR